MDMDAGNEAIRNGSIGQTIQSILTDLKAEAAYFTDHDGKRTAYVVLDMQDVSQIPAIAEPWFLAFKADVEIHPAMTMEDLSKAAPAIQQVVKKYS